LTELHLIYKFWLDFDEGKKMKSLKKLFWIGIIVFSFVAAGCAGSKPSAEPESSTTTQKDEYDEIEQLLGITPEERQATTTPQQNQDDLLDLLTKENQTKLRQLPAARQTRQARKWIS